MPADADSLAALGELASTSGHHAEPSGLPDEQVTVAVATARRRRPALPGALASIPALRSPRSVPAFEAVRALPRRTQLVALAAASVVAGLVAGAVVPVASATPAPASAGTTAPTILALPAARSAAPATAPRTTAARTSTSTKQSSKTSTKPTATPVVRTATTPARATAVTLATALPALAATTGIDWATATATTSAVRASRATTTSPRAVEAAPTRPSAQTIADARAYKPTAKLPASSGTGRRIVYAQHRGHLWIVGADGRVLRDYPVTGRIGRPSPGTYRVFSKSPTAVNPKAKVRFDLMVRFAHGITGAPIGFHTIPRWFDGRPIQRVDQLGEMIGAGGCVRQSKADARWLYAWAKVGERVVVLR